VVFSGFTICKETYFAPPQREGCYSTGDFTSPIQPHLINTQGLRRVSTC
jgi:hypothetical protein